MKNFQKSNRWKYIIQSKPFLIFLGIVILVFFYSMFSFANKMEETKKNRQIIEDKIAELEKSKETFSSDIGKLKTERGQEGIIREKYGVAKEGENMILIVEDKNSTQKREDEDSGGFFSWLKNLLQ